MNLNDEVFLTRLRDIVNALERKWFFTILPCPKPETVEQYQERLERYQELSSVLGEKLREMKAILELAEPEGVAVIARYFNELLKDFQGFPTPLNPVSPIMAVPGHPMRVAEKKEDEEKEAENQTSTSTEAEE